MEYRSLSNGVRMPILGYGTLQIPQEQTKECVLHAIQAGYRLLDTAASYLNEEEVGQAIQASNVVREEIFLTTKVWVQDAGYEETIQAFEKSLQKLKVDYVDLYLIHQPYGDYYGSWRALEALYKQGRVKAIGVCNFSAERFVDLCLNAHIAPMINQIEFHPLFQQCECSRVMHEYGCQIQAWGPLNEGQRDIFNHRILKAISHTHHKSVAQIILRWHIQQKVIAIPKSIHKERMIENMDIWDFQLSEDDMSRIHDIDIGYSEIINHQSYTTAKWLNTYKIHQ